MTHSRSPVTSKPIHRETEPEPWRKSLADMSAKGLMSTACQVTPGPCLQCLMVWRVENTGARSQREQCWIVAVAWEEIKWREGMEETGGVIACTHWDFRSRHVRCLMAIRVVVSISNVTVSRRFLNVSVSSDTVTPKSQSGLGLDSRHSNVSVSSQSRHHRYHLHRTSKVKLITQKSLFSRDTYRLLKYLCWE